MGKKARLKRERLAEQQGAKSVIEQIMALNEEIAGLDADIANLQASKQAFMEASFTGNDDRPKFNPFQFLNDSQQQAVIDILNRPNLDDIAQTKLVREYLGQFEQQLTAQGMNYVYLTYAIMYIAGQIRRSAAATNEPHQDDPLGPMSRQ